MKQYTNWIREIVLVLALWFSVIPAHAADSKVLIEVLERPDCVHCQAERVFLDDLAQRRQDVEIRFYDITEIRNKRLFEQVAEKADLSKSTPITIVGGTVLQGFGTSETTGKNIEALIEKNRLKEQVSFDQFVRSEKTEVDQSAGATCADGLLCADAGPDPLFVAIPFIGTFDVTAYSLPTLAAVLGFLDGFNPCAMWVLVTFLIVLTQIGSRSKMWTVAGLFILAEAAMYYLILNVWFRAWDFVGLDRVVTPIIGALAIGGGLFFLYEWYKSLGTEMACRVVDAEKRSKIVSRIKAITEGKLTIMSVVGIIGLALSVNVIEFACSIGYPQAFTKIIEMNALDFWQTQWYMFIYILFYMIDDFLVFGLALWGFDKLHLTQSYSKWSALVGGIFMLLLGYLLIFAPEALKGLG